MKRVFNGRRGLAAVSGALTGLALVALTASPLFADDPDPTPTPTPGDAQTHEQMHQMMDALGGPGTSQRMHDALDPNSEQRMDQCVNSMGNMDNRGGMMGSGMMGGGMMGGGMMSSGAGSGMPGGPGGRAVAAPVRVPVE